MMQRTLGNCHLQNNKNGVKSKHGDKVQGIHFKNDTDETRDDLSAVLLANMAIEKEVLNCLREQLEDLRRQSGKDQLLKEAEAAKNKISTIQSQVNELKQLAAEKDSLTKSRNCHLQNNKNGVKSKHGDKVQGIHFKNDTDETRDDLSAVLLANMAIEKEVLNCLREQLEDLRRQSGKDQLLKEAEAAKNKISTIQSQVNELKQLAAEKDSLTKSS
ncbi:unnamed protein product [Amaranthus hypochondriacus]